MLLEAQDIKSVLSKENTTSYYSVMSKEGNYGSGNRMSCARVEEERSQAKKKLVRLPWVLFANSSFIESKIQYLNDLKLLIFSHCR